MIVAGRWQHERVDDERILHVGHAPTPFTADEIRAHCVDGLRVTRAVHGEDEVTFATTTFRDGDADGVTVEDRAVDRDGAPAGAVQSSRVSWRELQGHASFPADTTVVGEETLTGPLGILLCRRYDVRRESGTSTFWFAIDHPGMPVRWEAGGSVVEVVDLTVVLSPGV